MAIEICAQAKVLSFVNDNFPLLDLLPSYEIPPILPQTLNLFSGKTCDQFLPNIFAPLCSCVGTCGDPSLSSTNDNLITYFYSDDYKRDKPGMWGCQVACQEWSGAEECKFWTLSKVYEGDTKYDENNQDSDIQRCYLWSSCDTFYIPVNTTNNPFTPGRQSNIPSDHWSGIKDCKNYTTICPNLFVPGTGSTGEYKVGFQY